MKCANIFKGNLGPWSQHFVSPHQILRAIGPKARLISTSDLEALVLTQYKIKLLVQESATFLKRRQWRTQGLSRWGTCPKWENKESLRKNKKNWLKFQERMGNVKVLPPGTVRLATALNDVAIYNVKSIACAYTANGQITHIMI